MEKTKFGVSVAFLSMLCYFTGYMNFTACILLLILALVWADSATLKKNACQAAFLSIFFDLIRLVLSWIAGIYGSVINFIFDIINNWVDLYELKSFLIEYSAFDGIVSLLGFVEWVLMIVLVILCLKHKTIKLPIISKIVNKHFDSAESAATESVAEPVVEEKPAKKTTRKSTKKSEETEASE